VDGRPLYLLASLGRTIYALSGDGQVAWRLRTEGSVYALDTLDDERLVAGDDAGTVTLFDVRGRRLHSHQLGSRVTDLLGGWQGGVLAGGWDEHLTFIDSEGKPHWQADLKGPLSAIAATTDLAIAATLDGQIQAFAPTGAPVWQFDAGTPITSLEITGYGQDASILLSLQEGRLLALDLEGTLRWQQALGTGGPIVHVADLTQDAVPDILVGSGGNNPRLALLSSDGRVMWQVELPSPVNAITSLDQDGDGKPEILTGLSSGEVHALDSQGRLRGSVHAGLSVWGLQPAGNASALILADVIAWQLNGGPGPAGRPWLPPPAMVQVSSDPLPTGTDPAAAEAILVFLGDVAPGRSMEAQLARYGPAHPWAGIDPLLRDADLAAANLECVLTTQGKPMDKSYLIRAHPRWGQTLVAAGLDLVTLGNNHALDFGLAGLDETLHSLEAVGISTIGAGPSQEIAHSPELFDLNGVRVAVLGYAAARWNGSVDVPSTDRLAWAHPAAVQADVRAVRAGADLVVVLLHAGTEYATAPSSDQVAVAHAAVDAGADLVVGHHPHVTQTVEQYRDGLIVYSLGDALFDIPRPAAMRGDLLRIHATRDGLVQAELWPFWIQDAIRPRLLDDSTGGPQFRIIYP
jgi:poly-gamma-glutamate synthesis protein (capsule biosynthesis protein)